VYWDGLEEDLKNWRPVLPESNVLDVVGNWVTRMMPYRAHDNRPFQPNQVAYEHNGNCGELQNLLCAASRTALIPNMGINNITWDHVWNEFWSPKDEGWKPYELIWNGTDTHIAKHGIGFDIDHGGGGQELACVTSERGDGFSDIVVPRYSDYADLTITVIDAIGNPVDRALINIMVPRNGGQDFMTKITGMQAVTNSNGIVNITVGDGRSFWAKVFSPKGSTNIAEKIITDSVAGESYTYQFQLSGIMPSHHNINELDTGPDEKDEFLVRINYDAEYEKFYGGPSAKIATGYAKKLYPGQIDFFIVDENFYSEYSSGAAFDGYHFLSDSENGEVDFSTTDNSFYMIFANPDVNQAVQFVNTNVDLYQNAGKIWVKRNSYNFSDLVLPQQTMELKFSDLGSPPMILYAGFGDTNLSNSIGGTLMVNAVVFDPDGQENIDDVMLYLGGKSTGIELIIVGDWEGSDLYSVELNIPPET